MYSENLDISNHFYKKNLEFFKGQLYNYIIINVMMYL